MQAILDAAQVIQEFVCDYTECEDFELIGCSYLAEAGEGQDCFGVRVQHDRRLGLSVANVQERR